MSNDELASVLESEITGSVGYLAGDLSEQRREAMERYYGEPYGDEAPGRSAVVMTEVRDTVEGIMPDLVEVFLSHDRIVTFEPTGAEDEEAAEQETDVVNYVILQQNEDSFETFYDWMKDALLQKNGIIKYWWEDSTKKEQETYTGLTEPEYLQLVDDDDVEVVEHTEEVGEIDTPEGPMVVTLHDVKVETETDNGRVRLACVPPEEFLISRRATTIEEAPFVGHKVMRTITELVEEGYDQAQLETLANTDDLDFNEERVERFQNDDEYPYRTDSVDRSMWEVEVTECYFMVDFDGDGVAEFRKIVVGGSSYEILTKNGEPDNEVFDGDSAPFASISSLRIAHKFFGLSIADLVMDIQRINTVLMRGVLDNQYLTNNPRKQVVEGQVNLDDMMTSRAGGIIRVKALGMIQDEVVQPIAQSSLMVMEKMDALKETRTGWTKYNQGLDSDALNKTATGVTKIMNASAKRIALIARLMAETGYRRMFLGVHELLRKHQNRPLSIKLRNGWVPVDPRSWRDRTDMTVNVGTGAGNADQRKADAAMVLGYQEKLAAYGLVEPQNVFNAFEKMIEAIGWRSADLYMKPPQPVDPNAPPPEEQPNPEMMKLQMEGQLEQAKMQAQAQSDQMKAQMDAQESQAKMQMDQMQFQAEHALEQQKFEFEKWLETQKLELQSQEVGAEVALKAMAQSKSEIEGTGVEGPADALGSS